MKKRSKVVRFVDIDETVFHTTAQIKIRSTADNSLIKVLSNKEWNGYSRDAIRAGREFADFSEFTDARKFNEESIPIEPMIKKLQVWSRQMKEDPNHADDLVVFVTARGDFDDRQKFLNTFRKNLVPIDDKDHFYIVRTGNLTDDARINGVALSTAQRKKIEYLHYLMSKMPTEAELYEDDMQNISDFLDLKKEMPFVKYSAFLVDNGKVKKVT